MKVLITAEYNDGNTIIKSYVDGIKKYASVESSICYFWHSKEKFDIIHIQWPEQLFNWRKLENTDIVILEERLMYWKEIGAKIIVTRHNANSHRKYPLDDELYDIVFENADGIIHLGEYGVSELTSNRLFASKANVIINHPNYVNILSDITRENARKKFNIHESETVYLVFGTIRKIKEEEHLVSAFNKLQMRKKKLIIARSMLFRNKPSAERFPLNRLKYEIKKYFLKRRGVIVMDNSHIPQSDLGYYLMAADILIIPRINQLNSGILYMAFTFSKIVVGPETGNIGMVLRKTNNFLYKPADIHSYTYALQKASESLHAGIGESNYQYAVSDCDIDKIGERHYEFYKKVLNNK